MRRSNGRGLETGALRTAPALDPTLARCQEPDTVDPRLRLGSKRRGEEDRRACHERSPVHYWITSSVRASTEGGIVSPSALAVLRLMTRSTFVDCCTGRSAGFSPLRIRPA